MAETVWKRRDCVAAEVEGCLVLLDLETLVYHALNSTAAAVWRMLEEPLTEPAIVAGLCERYDVSPAQCAASVDRLLQTFLSSQLVTPEPAV